MQALDKPANIGVDVHHEQKSEYLYRDSRPLTVRLGENLAKPDTIILICIIALVLALFAPLTIFPLTIFFSIYYLWFINNGVVNNQLPMQIPQQEQMLDYSDLHPKTRKPGLGKGIMYLGNVNYGINRGKEIWTSNDQARTHFLIAGTTGSGKTQSLLGFTANALSWGSGCVFVDGKADATLPNFIAAQCQRMGRDDDLYVLNYMTGGVDPFTKDKSDFRRGNKFNPISRGSSDDLTQLISSLMAEAAGDNKMWQERAIMMVDAMVRGLCYQRAYDGVQIDIQKIREAISLQALIMMTRYFLEEPRCNDRQLQSLVLEPLKSYLVNLPGLDWQSMVLGISEESPVNANSNRIQGTWDTMPSTKIKEETKKQHDFLSMQLLRALQMMADTYGSIFRSQIPEIDLLDVILNNRLLVVMIPSLEKSDTESAALGKLVVTSLRMMMSMNLGDKVEGETKDIVDSRPTNSPCPFFMIFDEAGYYFDKGMRVMFAQARSIGFAGVLACQDFPALMAGATKEAAETVIANTKIKMTLAMEDSQTTADFFSKTFGKAQVSQTSGFTNKPGLLNVNYVDRNDAAISERDKVTLEEMRSLQTGQGIISWRNRVIRTNTFTPFISGMKRTPTVRINRLLALHPLSDKQLLEFGFCMPDTESLNKAFGAQIIAQKLIKGNFNLANIENNSDYSSTQILLDQYNQLIDSKGTDKDIIIWFAMLGKVKDDKLVKQLLAEQAQNNYDEYQSSFSSFNDDRDDIDVHHGQRGAHRAQERLKEFMNRQKEHMEKHRKRYNELDDDEQKYKAEREKMFKDMDEEQDIDKSIIEENKQDFAANQIEITHYEDENDYAGNNFDEEFDSVYSPEQEIIDEDLLELDDDIIQQNECNEMTTFVDYDDDPASPTPEPRKIKSLFDTIDKMPEDD